MRIPSAKTRVAKVARAAPVISSVWLLSIEHQHGNNFYACATEGLSAEILRSYVLKWWTQEMGDIPEPPLAADMIDQYFEATTGRESYQLVKEIILHEFPGQDSI